MADTVPLVLMLAQALNKESSPKPRKRRKKKDSEEKPLTPAQEAARRLKEAQVAALTPKRRSEIASKASRTRWAKEKGKKKH